MRTLIFFCCSLITSLAYTQEDSGKQLYETHCDLCHREKGEGAIILERRLGEQNAILENRNNLNEAYIRAVVRKGIGSMQGFNTDVLSNEQVAMISSYLLASKVP